MHYTNPFNAKTSTGRVFSCLCRYFCFVGEAGKIKFTGTHSVYWTPLELTWAAKVTAVSTQLSEIRHYLQAHPELGLRLHSVTAAAPGHFKFYRLERVSRNGARDEKRKDSGSFR